MVRGVFTGLLLAFVAGCAPRNAVVVVPVPALEVSVREVEGQPLVTTAPDPREDGRGQGELVDVEWRGSWWPATLLERRGARWLVHYDGYGDDWNEVVSIERIRDRRMQDDEPVIEPMDEDVDP
jgi:hypothetical protein